MFRGRKLQLLLGGAAVGLITLAASMAAAGTVDGTVSFRRGTANLVVYVAHASGHFAAPSHHAVMDQRHMHFNPFALPIVKGTTVDFPNHDTVVHNVFSPDGERYDLGTWPPGQTRSHTFNQEGIYTQACSLHPEMEAYILVLQNPYYGVVQADGSFQIQNIPDGDYQLKVWGKRVSHRDQRRTFPLHVAGGAGHVNIEL